MNLSDMFRNNLTRAVALLKLDKRPPPGADDGDIERFLSFLWSDQLFGVLYSYTFCQACALLSLR